MSGPGRAVEGGQGGHGPPNILPCLASKVHLWGKSLAWEKFKDFLGGKATHAQKNQGFSEEKASPLKFFFWRPQSQNPTSLPATTLFLKIENVFWYTIKRFSYIE